MKWCSRLQGHQGINRCLLQSMSSAWWPGVSKAVKAYVKNYPHCQKTYIPPQKPLIGLPLPQRQRVAADLFELDSTQHFLIIDYYSRYLEVIQLNSECPHIYFWKTYGIPSTLVNDNGPQINCSTFTQFSSQYGFHHVTNI